MRTLATRVLPFELIDTLTAQLDSLIDSMQADAARAGARGVRGATRTAWQSCRRRGAKCSATVRRTRSEVGLAALAELVDLGLEPQDLW